MFHGQGILMIGQGLGEFQIILRAGGHSLSRDLGALNPPVEMEAGRGDGEAGAEAGAQGGIIAGKRPDGGHPGPVVGHFPQSKSIQCRPQTPAAGLGTDSDQIQAAAVHSHDPAEGPIHLEGDESFHPLFRAGDQDLKGLGIETMGEQFAIEGLGGFFVNIGIIDKPIMNVRFRGDFQNGRTVLASAEANIDPRRSPLGNGILQRLTQEYFRPYVTESTDLEGMGGIDIVDRHTAIQEIHIGELFDDYPEKAGMHQRAVAAGQQMSDGVHAQAEVIAHPRQELEGDQTDQAPVVLQDDVLRLGFEECGFQKFRHRRLGDSHGLELEVFMGILPEELLDLVIPPWIIRGENQPAQGHGDSSASMR